MLSPRQMLARAWERAYTAHAQTTDHFILSAFVKIVKTFSRILFISCLSFTFQPEISEIVC